MTILSLLAVVLYILAIIGLAAVMTWLVVKIFPLKKPEDKQPAKS